MLVLGVLMFPGAGLVIGPADDRQERLEARGARVEGIVIKASTPFRSGPSSVCFRYVFGGREYVVSIYGSGGYDVGERVTVYVDPDHPASATLPGEQPQSPATYWLTMTMIVSSLWLMLAGVVGLWKAWRQRRARSDERRTDADRVLSGQGERR
jgi:Protein of unknown function (DUF3592)